jgi:hypothetical protein
MGKEDDSFKSLNTESIDKITDKVKLNLSWEGMFSYSSLIAYRVIKSLRVVKQKPAYSESMGSKLSISQIIKEMKVHSRFVSLLSSTSIILCCKTIVF